MRERTKKRSFINMRRKWLKSINRVIMKYENSDQVFSYMDDDFNKILKGFILFEYSTKKALENGREATFASLKSFMNEKFKEKSNGIQD